MIFTKENTDGMAYDVSSAVLDKQHRISISRVHKSKRMKLHIWAYVSASLVYFTAAQARAVAAELLAFADACDAQKNEETAESNGAGTRGLADLLATWDKPQGD